MQSEEDGFHFQPSEAARSHRLRLLPCVYGTAKLWYPVRPKPNQLSWPTLPNTPLSSETLSLLKLRFCAWIPSCHRAERKQADVKQLRHQEEESGWFLIGGRRGQEVLPAGPQQQRHVSFSSPLTVCPTEGDVSEQRRPRARKSQLTPT